jgi:hypothetical protein
MLNKSEEVLLALLMAKKLNTGITPEVVEQVAPVDSEKAHRAKNWIWHLRDNGWVIDEFEGMYTLIRFDRKNSLKRSIRQKEEAA